MEQMNDGRNCASTLEMCDLKFYITLTVEENNGF